MKLNCNAGEISKYFSVRIRLIPVRPQAVATARRKLISFPFTKNFIIIIIKILYCNTIFKMYMLGDNLLYNQEEIVSSYKNNSDMSNKYIYK